MLSDAQARALRALSDFLVAKTSMGDTLLNVSQITVDDLPAAEMAGISLLGRDGRPTTDVFTDEQAPDIGAAQYESGRGPCLDSWREGKVIRLDDVQSAADAYPESTKAKMTADQAFDALCTASQRENLKVRDIAQRIVERKPADASRSGLR